MMFVFFHCLHTLFMSKNRHHISHYSAYTQNLLTHLFLPIFTMHLGGRFACGVFKGLVGAEFTNLFTHR